MRLLRRSALLLAVALLLVPAVFRALAYYRETEVAAQAAPATGRYVDGDDVRMFIQETGPASGPTVLLVPGSGAWSESWRSQLTALAQAGFHAVALDLPPFGYSERPTTPRYSTADQAARILATLDALRVQSAALVGHSFGGGPTVEAAMAAPERISTLILVDAALAIRAEGEDPPPPSALVVGALVYESVRNALVATFLTNPWLTRRLLRGFIADPAKATDERVALLQRPLSLQGSTVAIAEWLPELVLPTAHAESESPEAYRALTMPVVAIWGALDTVTPVAHGQRIVDLVPHGRLDVLSGVGHVPQLEDEDACNAALLRALPQVRPRR